MLSCLAYRDTKWDLALQMAVKLDVRWRVPNVGGKPVKSILCASLLIVLMPSAYAAQLPGDSADGSFLHDANCLGCHDTGIYTRKDRLVRSLDALEKRLGDCSHMAKKEFSATETQNIIKYLNDQFYQFR